MLCAKAFCLIHPENLMKYFISLFNKHKWMMALDLDLFSQKVLLSNTIKIQLMRAWCYLGSAALLSRVQLSYFHTQVSYLNQ